jgi:ribonuclease E
MTRRMLIDAGHREETRVVVIDGQELQEFDVESSTKSQLKGNIYLAKVTRVEPSLQAAFIDYGGNRHGFLAFSEIHPDYFQIPVSDRQALAADQARLVDAARDADEHEDDRRAAAQDAEEDIDDEPVDEVAEINPEGADNADEVTGQTDEEASDDGEAADDAAASRADNEDGPPKARRSRSGDDDNGDDREQVARREAIMRRGYKIQEVIKRRQILLVQVVKEERGNKGAALTTFMSIAGRYCVLMPNTPRGGGISRKIADVSQRRRLKSIASELNVPDGTGLIIRTAGMGRTKPEIKRDFLGLLKQWEGIREETLKSTAPTLIYEEANIIKRAIRDLYTKDIDEVLVEGDEGYKMAKSYMRFLMPSHAKRVQQYTEAIPLFHRFSVESKLDAMHSPTVQLRSGGYIVINPTEALVAIDINSGRSTKERNIEETALKTNVEAAEEIARQLRLRDLAGLIVIDFIDMDEHRNDRTVERKLKDALKDDRARIQVGRISSFGLLELSRQRLRPSLHEALSDVCAHCGGSGYVRSIESTALHVLRGIEQEGMQQRAKVIRIRMPTEIALYLLNDKRGSLIEIEQRYDMTVLVERDDDLIPPEFKIETVTSRTDGKAIEIPAQPVQIAVAQDDEVDEVDETEEADGGDDAGRRRKRRRKPRRRRGGETDREAGAAPADGPVNGDEEEADDGDGAARAKPAAAKTDQDEEEDGEGRKRRRRGKRGGRRRRGRGDAGAGDTKDVAASDDAAASAASGDGGAETAGAETSAADGGDEAPKRSRRRRSSKTKDGEPAAVVADDQMAAPAEPPAEKIEVPVESKPDETPVPAAAEHVDTRPAERPAAAVPSNGNGSTPAAKPKPTADDVEAPVSEGPPRRGWWQKITG